MLLDFYQLTCFYVKRKPHVTRLSLTLPLLRPKPGRGVSFGNATMKHEDLVTEALVTLILFLGAVVWGYFVFKGEWQ